MTPFFCVILKFISCGTGSCSVSMGEVAFLEYKNHISAMYLVGQCALLSVKIPPKVGLADLNTVKICNRRTMKMLLE